MTALPAPRKDYSPRATRGSIDRCDMVNVATVAQPPAKVLFKGTFLFLRRLHAPIPVSFHIEE